MAGAQAGAEVEPGALEVPLSDEAEEEAAAASGASDLVCLATI